MRGVTTRAGLAARFAGLSCALAAGACAFALAAAPAPQAAAATSAARTVTVEAPLIQAGAKPGAQGTAGSAGAVSAKASTSLDKATRKKLTKRFTQAIESMRTVESARVVKAGSLKIKASKKNQKRIARLVGDIVNFHPEYFYVSAPVTLVIDSRGCYSSFQLHYAYKFSSLKSRLAKCEKGLADLLSWVSQDATDLQKVKVVHDWLVRNCTYDANLEHEKDKSSPYNIYGALVTHKPVCQGYALAFLLAMQQLGIKATCVGQYIGDEGHMWNRVELGGNWYNVDVTLDDPYAGISYSYQDGGFNATPSTRYFVKSDRWWTGHTASGGWHASWYPKGVAGTDSTYDSKKRWESYLRAATLPSVPRSAIVTFDDFAVGTQFPAGSGQDKAVYQVTGEGTVAYCTCAVSKTARAAKVPAAVKSKGRTFAVTGIAKGAFAGRPGVQTVTVSPKGLEAARAKGCLAGSKVKAVKVPASKRGAYKKVFAKANSGRSVKVR